jgi:exonuclease SbcD
MRMLHLSDTHIGKKIGRVGRESEYDAIADELCDIAAQEKPDLIVHSGDMFETRRPATDDLRRGTELLWRLSRHAPVVVCAGNHDSPIFFDWLDSVLALGAAGMDRRFRRIRLIGSAPPTGPSGILAYPGAGGAETIRLAVLPYVHPGRALSRLEEPARQMRAYAELLAAVMSQAATGLQVGYRPDRDVRIFMAHQFVEGSVPSYCERRVDISDDYAASTNALPSADYLALGHIHKPQRVGRKVLNGSYAGSTLQFDFGEVVDRKSVALINVVPGRQPRIEAIALSSGRRLRSFRGTLPELAAWASDTHGAYVKAIIESERPIPDLFEQVQSRLPRSATLIKAEPLAIGSTVAVLSRASGVEEQPDDLSLFREYLAQRAIPGATARDAAATLEQLLEDVRLGQHEREFPEERALNDALGCCADAEGAGTR